MFKRMKGAEQVHKGVTTSKISTGSEANRYSHVRKLKRVEASLPTNPKKFRTDKRKAKNLGCLSNAPTGEKYVLDVWPQTLLRVL